jgi:hypothetical protein
MPTDLTTIPREGRTIFFAVSRGAVNIYDKANGRVDTTHSRRHVFTDDADQLDYLDLMLIAFGADATVREMGADEHPEAVQGRQRIDRRPYARSRRIRAGDRHPAFLMRGGRTKIFQKNLRFTLDVPRSSAYIVSMRLIERRSAGEQRWAGDGCHHPRPRDTPE